MATILQVLGGLKVVVYTLPLEPEVECGNNAPGTGWVERDLGHDTGTSITVATTLQVLGGLKESRRYGGLGMRGESVATTLQVLGQG